MSASTLFFTQVSLVEQVAKARLLIDSIRRFGGAMSNCPIWVFEADSEKASCVHLGGRNIEVKPLDVPSRVEGYPLAAKVFACNQAEKLARLGVRNLVWLAADCLIVKPPVLLGLGEECDVAVRPVHHRNIGLTSEEALDGYWKRIYREVGLEDAPDTVESYVDELKLRAYYNTHMISAIPARGLFQRWYEIFDRLVADGSFQSNYCSDLLHRIFLHQAPLSALISAVVQPGRVRLLPPDYSYPYNLHESIAEERKAGAINNLTCLTYENRPLDPDQIQDIDIEEPLCGWLKEHAC